MSGQLGISGAAHAVKFGNPTFYGYIWILLIKPNSMIYICYMLYKINIIWMQKTCMLAIRDNKPSVEDDKDTLLEAAEGMGTCGTLGDYMDRCYVPGPILFFCPPFSFSDHMTFSIPHHLTDHMTSHLTLCQQHMTPWAPRCRFSIVHLIRTPLLSIVCLFGTPLLFPPF